MNINEIKHLEELAKLELSEDERKKTAKEINEVVEYFNTLKKLDTEGVEPLSFAFGLKNVLRDDEVEPSLSASLITSNAETENGFFVVPVSIEGEE